MTNTVPAFPLPDAILDGDIAVLGRKGGGKTFTAKGIVERLLDMGRRVLVLDPLGVWAGLRTGADGETPGYPVAIFGGEHADMPLDPAAAAALADVIARENLPAVIDLSDLSKGAQGAFLLKFLHELRTNREALTIVLEEADVFAPQNPQGDDSKALHGEIDWIARRGRFRGFRLITITQRPARLSKDVLTQANCLIMHRLPAPQDREAAKAWVDGNGDRDQSRVVFDTLAGLKVGEAWVLAQEPAMLERAGFPLIKTLDTSATPKAGERRIEPKTLAEVDLSGIRAALAEATKDVPKPVGKKAAPDDEIAAAEKRGYDRGYSEGVENGRAQAIMFIDSAMQGLVSTVDRFRAGEAIAPISRLEAVAAVKAAPVSPAATKPAAAGMTPSTRSILDAIHSAYPAGLSFDAAAKRAGVSKRSSQFRLYRSQVLASGEVEQRSDGKLVSDPERAPTSLQAPRGLEDFKARLSPSYASMLAAIEASAPAALTKDEIAMRAGVSPTSSGLGSGLRELQALGLIVPQGQGLALSPDFAG